MIRATKFNHLILLFQTKYHKQKALLLGLIIGFLSSCLGIGGGIIMIPALMKFFNNNIKKAIGTSLCITAPIAFFGAFFYYIKLESAIRFDMAIFAFIGSVIGSQIGSILENKIKNEILEILFAFLLLLIGLKLIGIINLTNVNISIINENALYLPTILLGILLGFFTVLFGIGGGVIIVPILTFLFSFPIHSAIATSLAIIVPNTILAIFFHKKLGNIDFQIAKFIIPTAIIGSFLGAFFANKLPAETLTFIFGLFLLAMAGKTFFQKLQRI